MFRPPNNLVVAPVTTAIFGDLRANATTSNYLDDFRATDINTKATVGSIILLIANQAVSGNNNNLTTNCSATFRPGVAAGFIALVNTAANNPADENDDVNAAILINVANSINWFTDLVNAAKKKPLSESNVEGYFAMVGHSGTKASSVAALINRLTPFFPDSIGDPNHRAALADGIWTTYRITRVSTGKILKAILPDFRALGITQVGDAVEMAIEACEAAPWDLNLSLQIPDKYKAYGCLFMEAAGTPIDKWYQGNKAKDDLPAARVRGAKEIFRRYLEVKNNVDGLNAIVTVAGFNTQAITNFF